MLIVGTGGLGKEVLGALVTYHKIDDICFFDEDKEAPDQIFKDYKVITSYEEAKEYLRETDNQFIIAIGHPRVREKLTHKLEAIDGKLASMVCSELYPFNKSYKGLLSFPGVGTSHGVQFGKGCVLHLNSSIGHDTKIGAFVNIGPGAAIIGPSNIGDYSYIGANATVLPNLTIGQNVIVGAGAIVDKDLSDNETFVGARP